MHLWDLKNIFEKEVTEPAFTIRTSPVTAFPDCPGGLQSSHSIFAMVGDSDSLVYSAGPEGTIRVTDIPPLDRLERYGATEFSYCIGSWESHTDAVWSLAHHSSENWLLSASADGTVKLWKTLDRGALLDLTEAELSHCPVKTFIYAPQTAEGPATPTCVNWVQSDPNLLLVGYTAPMISMFNRETSQYALLDFHREKTIGVHQTNAIGTFPQASLAVSGHEDRRLRFFDLNTCSQVKDLAGHTDAISSLHVHSSGNYVVSGGHDGSLRFWDIRKFQCLHELPAHRRKYDEAVHCLAQHPTLPLFASAGADSLIKVYRCKL
jgi:striatin 1/3/4